MPPDREALPGQEAPQAPVDPIPGCAETGRPDVAAKAKLLADLEMGSCDALIAPWKLRSVDELPIVWDLITAKEPWSSAHSRARKCDCTTTYHARCGDAGTMENVGAGGAVNNTFDTFGIRGARGTYLAHGVASHCCGNGGPPSGPAYDSFRETVPSSGVGARRGTRIRNGMVHSFISWSYPPEDGRRPPWMDTPWVQAPEYPFYLRIVEDGSLASGDLCYLAEIRPLDTCAKEGVGTVRIHAADEIVVTYDGDATCDGCGMVTIGGEAAGRLCGLPTWPKDR